MMRQSIFRWSLVIISMLITKHGNANPLPFPTEKFGDFVKRLMNEFEIPGLAITIVKDGSLVLARGYGVRNIQKPALVDRETLFGIASNTKAFTSAALAILVDEGKIGWDDKVQDHLAYFQMYVPYVTREMTIRDLLTHRSGLGLGAGDLLIWPRTTYTSKQIIQRLQYIKPSSSFRNKFAYTNLPFIVAGEILSAITGQSWSDFVTKRILVPVGMKVSRTGAGKDDLGTNIASSHVRADGNLKPVRFNNIENAAPASSIISCATDMAKWLKLQLNLGLVNTSKRKKIRLYSIAQAREMWSAQTSLPVNQAPPYLKSTQPNFVAYGLGWFLSDYRGQKMVGHGGTLMGMASRVTLIPEKHLGIAILTNQEDHDAVWAITYRILDHYFELVPSDWISKFKRAKKQREKNALESQQSNLTARAKSTKPSLDLINYAGKYTDIWYGDMTIQLKNKTLVMQFAHSPDLVGDLEHWHYDTFVVRWHNRGLNADAYVTFTLDHLGRIEHIKMTPLSTLIDFSYNFQDLLFRPTKKPS